MSSYGVLIAVAAAVLGLAGPVRAAEGLNLVPDPVILGMNLVLFVVLMVPIYRLLLKPLVTILEQRDARTAGALARAESMTEQSGSVQDALQERLAAARRDAIARRSEILAAAEGEERGLLGQAREEAAAAVDAVRTAVAGELEAVRRSLESDVRELAREVAGRVLGRSL